MKLVVFEVRRNGVADTKNGWHPGFAPRRAAQSAPSSVSNSDMWCSMPPATHMPTRASTDPAIPLDSDALSSRLVGSPLALGARAKVAALATRRRPLILPICAPPRARSPIVDMGPRGVLRRGGALLARSRRGTFELGLEPGTPAVPAEHLRHHRRERGARSRSNSPDRPTQPRTPPLTASPDLSDWTVQGHGDAGRCSRRGSSRASVPARHAAGCRSAAAAARACARSRVLGSVGPVDGSSGRWRTLSARKIIVLCVSLNCT